jgi:hypothetical protein
VETLRWDDVEEWFDPSENGSAPDVVVPDTSVVDWDALVGLIRSEGWPCKYEAGDRWCSLPPTAAELFDAAPEGFLRNLWVWPDPGLEWIIRLGTPDAIVSDVDLHEIQGQERLDAFCRFLRILGVALRKSVLVYAEGDYVGYPPMMTYEAAADRVIFLAASKS